MDASPAPERPATVVLSVPEIRDYRAIDQELLHYLDRGCSSIRLTGASGQRLLVSGLIGRWSAVIEIEGNVGPELGAELDAPGLTVVCRGSAADGAASGLKAGRVLILGEAGPALGYAQRGGLAMVAGAAGARAGLCQRGGTLIVLGRVGPMAGERQAGGRLLIRSKLGPHAGRGRRGGHFASIDPATTAPGVDEDRAAMQEAWSVFSPWMTPDLAGRWPDPASGAETKPT